METNINELPLGQYGWSTFSFLDTVKYKIHLFFVWIFCSVFGMHDWIVVVTPWDVSDISSLEDFQKYRARQLKCSCCGLESHISEVTLTPSQKLWYEFRTTRYFEYHNT